MSQSTTRDVLFPRSANERLSGYVRSYLFKKLDGFVKE